MRLVNEYGADMQATNRDGQGVLDLAPSHLQNFLNMKLEILVGAGTQCEVRYPLCQKY